MRQRPAVDLPVRETEAGEFGTIGGVDFRAHPLVAVGEQAATIGAEAAADVDDAARWRAEIAAEQHRDFAAAFGERRAFGKDVVVALNRGGA